MEPSSTSAKARPAPFSLTSWHSRPKQASAVVQPRSQQADLAEPQMSSHPICGRVAIRTISSPAQELARQTRLDSQCATAELPLLPQHRRRTAQMEKQMMACMTRRMRMPRRLVGRQRDAPMPAQRRGKISGRLPRERPSPARQPSSANEATSGSLKTGSTAPHQRQRARRRRRRDESDPGGMQRGRLPARRTLYKEHG